MSAETAPSHFQGGLKTLLAPAADLLQPLVYRRAINAVAGLFVDQAPTQQILAPQTPDQTLTTLVESVILLFFISVIGYFFSLRSDYYGAKVASTMEANLIVSTFGHVLRLPTSFFARRASAGIAKRIDQSDQLAPVVHAFSQQIAPEAIRLVGICAITFSENWEMALVSLFMLPPYLWIARRSALRMKTGIEPHLRTFGNISARITDALASAKTVRSPALKPGRGTARSRSHYARGVYIERIRTARRYYIWQSALSSLSKSMVLGYGGWLVLRYQLTPGDVVMFAS